MYLAVHAQQDPTAIFAKPFANINLPIKLHSSHLRAGLPRTPLGADCRPDVHNESYEFFRLERILGYRTRFLSRSRCFSAFCVRLRITSSGAGPDCADAVLLVKWSARNCKDRAPVLSNPA
jgi:hypothetical protein